MSDSGAVLAAGTAVSASASRPGLVRRVLRWRGYPLLAILAVQAVVSGRFAWVNSAFGDEAHYLYSGHLEWRAWLHGTPAPVLHLPGAPQIYPPLGAAVDALGGLAAARLLSLAFMLGATVLLYLTACRLFGRTAAVWAAGLGAFGEPVLRLDFATFDGMAILLLMAGLYLAVRSIDSGRAGELVAAAGVCLLTSALVAVAYAFYVPVVAAVMLCVWAERRGWDNALVPVIWQFILIGGLAVVGISRLHVWTDFVKTTVNRTAGPGAGVPTVLSFAWSWAGPVIALGVVAAVLGFAANGGKPRGWLVFTLALAGAVVPAYQAYLGTTYSMDKHMAPGAEMAAVAAGYGAGRVRELYRARRTGAVPGGRATGARRIAVLGLPAVLLSAFLAYGTWRTDVEFGQWPDTAPLISALRAPLGADTPSGARGAGLGHGGSLLVDTSGLAPYNPAIFSYYLPGVNVGSSSGKAAVAEVAAGGYRVVVQKLESAALESDAAPGPYGAPDLTPALRQAAATQDKVGAELASGRRYAIVDVLPYVTTSAADPAGVFVVWTAVPAPAPAPK